MTSIRNLLAVCICVVGLSAAGFLYAHGTGASFETEQNDVLIDIGYTPEQFVAGERVRLDLDVYDAVAADTPRLEFTNVWLRLTQQGRVFYSGNQLNPATTQTVVSLTLPDAGEYELSARFYNNDTIVADGVFPLTIDSAATTDAHDISAVEPSSWRPMVVALLSITLLLAGAYWFGLTRRKSPL